METSAALYHLFTNLPRLAPGSTATTEEALRRLPALPETPVVADFGCGTGASALVLAEILGSPVLALDIHEPYLIELRARAAARGLGHLVQACAGDLAAPPLAPGAIDLIWADGAIWVLGFRAGLDRWRALLRRGGLIAATDVAWLGDERPIEAVAFWREEYPAIAGVAENEAAIADAGFDLLDRFVLPQQAWWDEFYTPLLARCDELGAEAADDAALARVIAATRREIDLFHRFGASYGYVFYLMRRRD